MPIESIKDTIAINVMAELNISNNEFTDNSSATGEADIDADTKSKVTVLD